MAFTRSASTVFLVLGLLTFGCESKKPDGAAPATSSNTNPGATPETAAKATATAATEKKTFPAADKFELPALAVGQWVRMVVTTAGHPPSQTYVRIIGKEGDSFWYEIENNAPTGTTVIQLLMDDATKGNFSKNSIKKMKLKLSGGPVQELSGPAMAAASAVVDNYIHLIGKPNLDKAERGDATVNAGEFKGCFTHDIDENILGMTMKAKSWNHPAVPINGFVRSEGTIEGKATKTELFEFHMDGAKSRLQ